MINTKHLLSTILQGEKKESVSPALTFQHRWPQLPTGGEAKGGRGYGNCVVHPGCYSSGDPTRALLSAHARRLGGCGAQGVFWQRAQESDAPSGLGLYLRELTGARPSPL